MHTNHISSVNRISCWLLAALLPCWWLLPSCTKSPHSIGGQEAANINIFNASHVYDSMTKHRYVNLSGLDTTNSITRLNFTGLGSYEIPGNGLVEAIRLDHPIHYYPFTAGRQSIQFADTNGAIVADTSLDFVPGGNYGVYLADDTAISGYTRPGTYRIFNFPEQLTNTPGKVRLRYIDLVPDVDTLNGYFFTPAGGKYTGPETPSSFTYGMAGGYTDLDTTGLVVSGQILLRLFRKKDTVNYYTQIPIPPTPGRTYTVLFFGNAGYFLCNFPVKQPDGTTKPKYVSYPPDIKGYVRTVD